MFCARWRCDEYLLARFMLEPSFVRNLLNEIRPWIARVQHVRRSIYLNATDPARKDQWFWMLKFQDMLTKYGHPKFLPPDAEPPKEKPHVEPAKPARRAAEPRPRAARKPEPDGDDFIELG